MMSQRQQTLSEIEIQYHESKTQTDACVAALLRGYKENINRISQENQQLVMEISKLKKTDKPDK